MDALDWSPAGDNLLVARADDVGVVRLDRPEALNALTPTMLPALATAIRSQAETRRGVVVTGTGRAFSAGDDLDATADLDRAGFRSLIEGFQDLTRAVLDTTVPVVAAVNGLVVGGAAELTLACDARIGHPDAFVLFPENGIGLTVSNASTLLLPRVVGPNALSLVLDGRRLEADRALALGLFTSIDADPVTAAVDLVTRWTTAGTATRWHLELFRPDRAAVEVALAREVEVAMDIFDEGLPTAGATRFRDRRR